MLIKDWKKDVFTIPNILSLFRLLLIPVYIRIYLNASEPGDYVLAGTILAVSCLTDLVDGLIARHFNQISNLGKLLDPIADKFTQLALVVCLSVRYPALYYVLAAFLTKEFVQFAIALIKFRQGKVLPGAIPAGKICTTVLFSSLTLMVLLPDAELWLVNTVTAIDFLFLVYAFVRYLFAFLGKNAKTEDLQL